MWGNNGAELIETCKSNWSCCYWQWHEEENNGHKEKSGLIFSVLFFHAIELGSKQVES